MANVVTVCQQSRLLQPAEVALYRLVHHNPTDQWKMPCLRELAWGPTRRETNASADLPLAIVRTRPTDLLLHARPIGELRRGHQMSAAIGSAIGPDAGCRPASCFGEIFSEYTRCLNSAQHIPSGTRIAVQVIAFTGCSWRYACHSRQPHTRGRHSRCMEYCRLFRSFSLCRLRVDKGKTRTNGYLILEICALHAAGSNLSEQVGSSLDFDESLCSTTTLTNL